MAPMSIIGGAGMPTDSICFVVAAKFGMSFPTAAKTKIVQSSKRPNTVSKPWS